MRPVIGITPLMDTKLDSYWMLPDYMQAVQQAGGLPLMLPFQYDDESINQMVELCDGLVFTGGEDIDPSWYHAERLPVCGESIAVRDELEIRLRADHMQRLANKQCNTEAGIVFLDALVGLERISDHSRNIAEEVLAAAK